LHGYRQLARSASYEQIMAAPMGPCVKVVDLQQWLPARWQLLTVHSAIRPCDSLRHAGTKLHAELQRLGGRIGVQPPALAELMSAITHVWAATVGAVTTNQCIAVRKALDARGLVLMPLDRDMHRNALCTVSAYLARLRVLFLEDTVHYRRVHHEVDQILGWWQQQFVQHGWQRYGKWNANGTLPNGYWFPKSKNIAKERPIVSCKKHPCKQPLSRAGRALIYLLCRVAFVHFNMRTVQELIDRIDCMRGACESGDGMLLLVCDIKEMYTGMLHSACIDAVEFVIERCLSTMKSPYVTVSTDPMGPVFAGKSKAAGTVCFHIKDLVQFVRFELSNLYFTVGSDTIMHQVVGAAMGGFTSPAAAQAVASVCEYRSMSILVSSGQIAAGRFMDDTLVFLNLSAMQRSGDPLRLAAVLRTLFTCYQPAGMLLELERCGWSVGILQSIVSVLGGQLHAWFWNKNAQYVETGIQHVCRFLPPATANLSAKEQRAVVSSLLHRVAASTAHQSIPKLTGVLQQLMAELTGIGFTPKLVQLAVRKFVHAQKHTMVWHAWHKVWKQLLCLSAGKRGQ
jgi:hypothetical protein